MSRSIRGSGMAEARVIHRRRSLRLWLGAAWLGLLVFAAIFAPFLSPHDRLAQDLTLQTVPPAWLAGAEPGYFLWTDSLGRDVLWPGSSAPPPSPMGAIT